MRRLIGTIGFAIAGLASSIAWAAIDSRLCSTFSRLCSPPAGECGGGVDTCIATTHTSIDLFAYLFGTPILFGLLGWCLFGRPRSPHVTAVYLASAIAADWLLTLLGVRILHI